MNNKQKSLNELVHDTVHVYYPKNSNGEYTLWLTGKLERTVYGYKVKNFIIASLDGGDVVLIESAENNHAKIYIQA